MMDSVVVVVAIIVCIMMTTWGYHMLSELPDASDRSSPQYVETNDQLRGQLPVGKIICTRPRFDRN